MDRDAPDAISTVPGGRLGPPILLGVGLGGLFDGIVLHQVLQWHHLLSTPAPPVTVEALQLNTLADGLFHAFAWVVAVVGLAWLTRSHARDRSAIEGRNLVAGLAIGWGAFNVIEGVVDHHLLNLHHVREGPDALAYDVAFLAWGAAMVLVGLAITRRETSAGPESPRRRGALARPGR